MSNRLKTSSVSNRAASPDDRRNSGGKRVLTEKNSRQQCHAVAGRGISARRPRAESTARPDSAARSRPGRPAARSCRGTRSRPAIPLVFDEGRDIDDRPRVRFDGRARNEAAADFDQLRTGRPSLESDAEIIDGHLEPAPGVKPAFSRRAAGITTRPALSMVVFMPSEYHAEGPPAGLAHRQHRLSTRRNRVTDVHALTVLAVIFSGSIAGVATLARQDPLQQPAPLAPGRAILAGRVVEAGTTRGVPDAVLRLSGPSLGSPATVFANGTTGGARSAVADGSGRFVFRDVPAGPYLLLAHASGYLQGVYGETRPSRSQSLPNAQRLDIGDADRPLNVTIQLWRPAGIGGLVRDESGDPIVGVSWPSSVARLIGPASRRCVS